MPASFSEMSYFLSFANFEQKFFAKFTEYHPSKIIFLTEPELIKFSLEKDTGNLGLIIKKDRTTFIENSQEVFTVRTTPKHQEIIHDYSEKLLKIKIEGLRDISPPLADSINSESRALEWIKTTASFLKGALAKASTDQDKFINFFLYFSKQEHTVLNVRVFNLEFLSVTTDSALTLNVFDYKDSEQRQSRLTQQFSIFHNQVFDEINKIIIIANNIILGPKS
jgi:hypothetical protein